MQLTLMQKIKGYTISNGRVFSPLNNSRLDTLHQHALAKLSPHSSEPDKVKAYQKAKVAHWSERKQAMPDHPQNLENKPAPKISDPALQPAPPVSATVASTAKPDSPTDTINQGTVTNCDTVMNSAADHYTNKCSCGKVINQCRCASPNKKVNTIENGCPECKAKLSNSEKLKSEILVELPTEKISNSAGKINNKFLASPDGFYDLIPKGQFPHPSGILQVIDDRALNSILTNFKDAKKVNPDHSLLVDFEHRSNTSDNTEAAGWITDMKPRENGTIAALINWSKKGQEAIDGGLYRGISPSWPKSRCEVVDGDPNRLRPMTCSDAGITNCENLPLPKLSKIV